MAAEAQPIYRNVGSIDNRVDDYSSARTRPLGSRSGSAASENYWNGEYMGLGALLGGAIGTLLTFGFGGLLWGAILGGAAGAFVNNYSAGNSSNNGSTRSFNPRLVSLYERAADYAKEAISKGYETEQAITSFVRERLAKDEGVTSDQLDRMISEYAAGKDCVPDNGGKRIESKKPAQQSKGEKSESSSDPEGAQNKSEGDKAQEAETGETPPQEASEGDSE